MLWSNFWTGAQFGHGFPVPRRMTHTIAGLDDFELIGFLVIEGAAA
jgi:hypothetical protein